MQFRDWRVLKTTILAALITAVPAVSCFAQGTLRIGMTASDIPLTTGQADHGAEGVRFMGYTLYDALINWDLSQDKGPSSLAPGLALSWGLDPSDATRTKWIFKLRSGVTFHDGSAFSAEAVIWNLDKLLKPESPQYDRRQAVSGRPKIPSVASYRATDPGTVEIVTKTPDATFPYQISQIMISSPAQWERLGKNWDAVAKAPSGTGPWKLTALMPRERAELVPNRDYWDKARIPKLDKLVLLPLPEPNARVAALWAGQVDWIEEPAPDAVESLKAANFTIVTNAYPHNWTWHLSRIEGSPWNDIRVRKAANLAIDRDGMKELLGGLMIPSQGFMPPGHPWFGHPSFKLVYDPAEARRLLREAGYDHDHPLVTKIVIATSGSGQMLPLPMNEFIQQNLADAGIKVSFEVVERNQLSAIWRAGAKDASAKGATAINNSYVIQDPFNAFIRLLSCDLTSPAGVNWGYYCDPAMDTLLASAEDTFDSAGQALVLQKIHEKIVDDALFLMVANDVEPRAMSRKVRGFVQAQNWFQDFSPVWIAP